MVFTHKTEVIIVITRDAVTGFLKMRVEGLIDYLTAKQVV